MFVFFFFACFHFLFCFLLCKRGERGKGGDVLPKMEFFIILNGLKKKEEEKKWCD